MLTTAASSWPIDFRSSYFVTARRKFSGRLFFAPACAIMAKIVLGGAFMNYTIRPIGPEDAEGAAASAPHAGRI